MSVTIYEVIQSLRPGAAWSCHGPLTYDGITWADDIQTMPTRDEVEAEMARLEPVALAEAARAKRDAALTACEWLATRHRDQTDAGAATTLTAAQYKELLTYRQALRDWPTTAGWPDVALPAKPAWLEA